MSIGGVLSSEPHLFSSANEYRLSMPPTDGITALHFAPDPSTSSKFLLVSSWDTKVRLYELGLNSASNFVRTSYAHQGPVLDCCFLQDSFKCASGSLDNYVKTYDLNAGSESILGAHEKAVRCVCYSSDSNILITGSWDSTIKIWDLRSVRCVGCYPQPERVYSMTISGDRLMVATAGRKILIWNIRNLGAGPEQKRDSSLKYQTRCIRSFPNGQGFVLSSIEGRVAVEYVDPSPESQKRKYAFKCHRSKEENGQELVFPVNAIAFHPLHCTFATGGSDALVNIWDPFNKKRLCQFHKYTTSISALAFSSDGSSLAMGASYQYELPEDPQPMPEEHIYIRKVTDQETKPKS